MELTSDNLFRFIMRKYNFRENKLKKQLILESNILRNKKSSITKEKEDKSKIKKYSKCLMINGSNISNLLYNSVDPFINECYKNVEYLSITDNYIKNIDFILNFPNLFYLDLYRNPLEDLTALNNKNIFGYLRLSIELYNERKILNIHDLQCGILDVDLKQKKYLKIFNMHNNHICMLNNQIQYFIDQIRDAEEKVKTNYNNNKKRFKKNDQSTISVHSNSNSEITNPEGLKESNVLLNSVLNLNPEIKKEYIPEKPIENIVQTHPFLLKIKDYFEAHENKIKSKLASENNNEFDKKRKTFNLVNNEYFKSKNLEENPDYLQNEKEKLILIFILYKKLSLFNKERNNNLYYIGNISRILVNRNIDSISIKELNTIINNKSLNIRSSIIILISFDFYIIGTISEKMFQALMNFILEKYYGFDENKKPPDFSNFGDIHYLVYYYSTFDYIYNRIKDLEKNINIEKYKDILNVLKMEKLILNSNYLYKKITENKLRDNNIEFCQFKKSRILKEIRSIKELKINKEFLILIQFLVDYIIFEKIEQNLINNSYPGEYSYLIELKETIEETEFQINNINFLSSLSLSALKYERNKKERIFNKFYFEKDKVKKIQNKEFKNYIIFNDLNRSNSMHNLNLNTSIIASTLFNNSKSNFNNNFNFEENDYNKSDDIDVDECFYIDSMQRKNNTSNNSNINIRINNNKYQIQKLNFKLNNNKYMNKECDSSNENSYQQEEIQLPSIHSYPNQISTNQEDDFLRNMVYNPEFLSQHARYILKFEKLTKKLYKKSPTLLKNKKIRNKLKSRNDEKNPVPLNDIQPGLIHTSYDKNFYKYKINNFNRANMNINLDENFHPINYNTNNNLNNFPFDKTNYSINIYQYHKNNIANRNKKMKKNFDEKFRQKKYIYNDSENNELNMQFYGVPVSFPGITLLNYGKNKNKTYSKNIKLLKRKKSLEKINKIKEEKKSYKDEVMNKIKETKKNNVLRNARRVAFSMYQ